MLPAGNFFVGGGAYCYNGGTIQNCTIMNNAVTSENCPSGTTYYCYGGGVHSWHAGVIQNCLLSGNRAVAKNTASGIVKWRIFMTIPASVNAGSVQHG